MSNNPGGPNLRIPMGVQVNRSSFSDARQQVRGLDSDLERLDAIVLRVANRLKLLDVNGKALRFTSVPQLEQHLVERARYGQPAIQSASLNQAMSAMRSRERRSMQAVQQGQSIPLPDREQQRLDARQQQNDQRRQRQEQAAQNKQALNDQRDIQRQQRQDALAALREQRQARALQMRSLTALGAFATGNNGGAMRSLAGTLFHVMATGGGTPGVGIGVAGLQSLALMGSASGAGVGGPLGGILSGLGNAGDMLLGSPLGLLGGGLLAAILGGNVAAAGQFRAEQLLSSSVGGFQGTFGNAFNLRSRAFGAAQRFHVDPQLGYNLMGQLGIAGVRANQISGALDTTLAGATQTGANPQLIARYVANEMVQGGRSASDVAKDFEQLGKQAEKTGIPLNRLLDGLTTLQQVTGGAAVNVASFAAVQAVMGAGINAGQALSPLMGATGLQSLMFGNLLGLTPDQFQQMQFGGKGGNPAGLMSAMARRVNQLTRGQDTGVNRDLAEWLSGQMGLDLSGVSPKVQAQLMHTMITNPNAFAQQVQQFGVKPPETWQQQMSDVAAKESSFLDNIGQILQNLENDLGGFYRNLGFLTDAIQLLIKTLTGWYDKLFGGHHNGPLPSRGAYIQQMSYSQAFRSLTGYTGPPAQLGGPAQHYSSLAMAYALTGNGLSGIGGVGVLNALNGRRASLSAATMAALRAADKNAPDIPLGILMEQEASGLRRKGQSIASMALADEAAFARTRSLPTALNMEISGNPYDPRGYGRQLVAANGQLDVNITLYDEQGRQIPTKQIDVHRVARGTTPRTGPAPPPVPHNGGGRRRGY